MRHPSGFICDRSVLVVVGEQWSSASGDLKSRKGALSARRKARLRERDRRATADAFLLSPRLRAPTEYRCCNLSACTDNYRPKSLRRPAEITQDVSSRLADAEALRTHGSEAALLTSLGSARAGSVLSALGMARMRRCCDKRDHVVCHTRADTQRRVRVRSRRWECRTSCGGGLSS